MSAEKMEAVTAHTPGPWREIDGHVTSENLPGANTICEMAAWLPHCEGEQRANARLIAAAPDLLQALQLLHDDIDEYQRINNLGGHDNHCMKLARAAIARATSTD